MPVEESRTRIGYVLYRQSRAGAMQTCRGPEIQTSKRHTRGVTSRLQHLVSQAVSECSPYFIDPVRALPMFKGLRTGYGMQALELCFRSNRWQPDLVGLHMLSCLISYQRGLLTSTLVQIKHDCGWSSTTVAMAW